MDKIKFWLSWKKWKLEICEGRKNSNTKCLGEIKGVWCGYASEDVGIDGLGGKSKPACGSFVVRKIELGDVPCDGSGHEYGWRSVCDLTRSAESCRCSRELNTETHVQSIKWYRRVAATKNWLLWNGCENILIVCAGGYWGADGWWKVPCSEEHLRAGKVR